MAQSKHEIQAILAAANSAPRHRFGQNFMIDQNLVRLVADAGEIQSNNLVIEVGPGTGTLTDEILLRTPNVIAVEIDRDLAAALRERFADRAGFRLIEGDALAGKHALNVELAGGIAGRPSQQSVKLVANLPYNIASPLIIELLGTGVDLLAFTVQKEVADRLRAPAGSDAYGLLSVMVQLLSRVEVLRTLPPQAFWPAPTIESALVRLTLQDRLGAKARAFNTFTQKLFAARRKTLRKALLQADQPADELMARTGLDPKCRPEEIPPEDFLRLYEAAVATSTT